MGPRPRDAQRDNYSLNLSEKLVKRELQLGLLRQVRENSVLLNTKILPSIRPKIGKLFHHRDLHQARVQILEQCAIPEAQRDTNRLQLSLNKALDRYEDRERIEKLIDDQNHRLTTTSLKRLDKKVKFHLDKAEQERQKSRPQQNIKRNNKRKRNAERRRAERKKYRTSKAAKKVEWMKNHVEDNIKGKLVINLSSQEVPDIAYLYLAKGLNFVESRPVAKEDLLFDVKEFLRKMEWKAYFHQIQADTTTDRDTEDIHKDLRLRSRKHPQDYNHPLFDEIKTRLMGFATNLNPDKPQSNLTDAEQRGKGWVLKSINEQRIFITSADKGGATLILDYRTVMDTVKCELEKETKFTKLDTSVGVKMEQTQLKVKEAVLKHYHLKTISEEVKKRITGVNEKGNMVHAPEIRPEIPYAYPLYKVHKLSQEQIEAKTIPPVRLVHATKGGPLYRLEKFVSPYITQISRKYCEEEFILDTPDIITQINNYNKETLKGAPKNLQLFTLDVAALYPSIRPELALTALEDALNSDTSFSQELKAALYEFTDLIFQESFVTYQGEGYINKEGIPTGNCISRQAADITMHWLLFKQIRGKMKSWGLIDLWRRFIDDVFGVWLGTVRQFNLFVEVLNKLAQPYGIRFADQQIGKTVNFLDITLTLDNSNQIQYRLYRKETDARNYLRTDSFHPEHVFGSVAFSQMIRVIERNSQDSTCVDDLAELKEDLSRSGHNMVKLEETEPRAVLRALENTLRTGRSKESDNTDTLVFSVQHSSDNNQLKKLIHELGPDIKRICGDIRVIFATRKHPSIGNRVVRNRQLRDKAECLQKTSQKCFAPGCKTCPVLFDLGSKIIVNGLELKLDSTLTCKDKHIIYVAQCQLCNGIEGSEDTYFGQTITPFHNRLNGHRSKFNIDHRALYEHSALSMHCYNAHRDTFSFDCFKFGIVKKTKPNLLDREEARFCAKFKTNVWGLNRMEIRR